MLSESAWDLKRLSSYMGSSMLFLLPFIADASRLAILLHRLSYEEEKIDEKFVVK